MMRFASCLVLLLLLCGGVDARYRMRGRSRRYLDLKFMTWNTYLLDLQVQPPVNESVLAEQAKRIAAAVKTESPDVVCFQEVWTPETKAALVAAMAPEYPNYTLSPEFESRASFVRGIRKILGTSGSGGVWNADAVRGSGLVTFTKGHIEIQHQVYRQFKEYGAVDGFWPKGMLGTHLKVTSSDGKNVGHMTVINTHLATYESYVISQKRERALHNQQTDQIQAFAAELREEAVEDDQGILIMGDFNIQSHHHYWSIRNDGMDKYQYLLNTGLWNDLWTEYTAQGVPLADPFGPNEEWTWCSSKADFTNHTQCGYAAIAAGEQDTDPATYDGGRIDYIWEYTDQADTNLLFRKMKVLAHDNQPAMVADHRAVVLEARMKMERSKSHPCPPRFTTTNFIINAETQSMHAYRTMCEGQENPTTGPNPHYVAYYINVAAGAGPCLPGTRNETDCCRLAPYW